MKSRPLVLALLLVAGLATPLAWTSSSHPVQSHSAYGRLPILFQANAGQLPADVKLVARRSTYALFLSSHETVLALKQAGAPALLRLRFLGANPNAEVVGLDRVAGQSSYFVGKDPHAWITGLANFARAEYRGIYPSTSLIFHGEDGVLEYDFRLAPGADPRAIAMSFAGAEKLEIDPSGDLLLHARGSTLRQHRPLAYQNGIFGRRRISASYLLDDDGAIRLSLGPYDPLKTLVIDPVLTYSTYLGGNADDAATAIAVDAQGNVYTTGQTLSTNFPLSNAFQSTCSANCVAGSADVFVTKLAPDGKSLIYSTYLGGNNLDQGFGIAVDSNGNAYITGMTSSGDFPVTSAAFQTQCQSHACGSGFVAKLNAVGNALVYSTYLGGSSPFDQGNAIAVDRNGNAYIAGMTTSIDFPTTPGAFSTKCGTDGLCNSLISDAFVTKLSADGSSLVFSTFLGGSSGDWAKGIAVDSLGSAYVVGTTFSADFPATPGAPQQTHGGFTDAFVTKLHPDGSSLDYSTFLGGSAYDYGRAIAVDSLFNAYVTGDTFSSDFPTVAGSFQTFSQGSPSAFITKITSAGRSMIYSTYLGGSIQSSGAAIALNSAGNAYITGMTTSSNFPTASPIQATCNACAHLFGSAYVTKLTADGSKPVFSTFLGGTFNDSGTAIAVDSNGDAYIAGQALSSDFPTTPGAFQTSRGTPGDAFIAKMSGLKLPVVTLPTPIVNFPIPQLVGTTSTQPEVITLENVGDGPFNISGFSATGDFAATNNCVPSVPGPGSCALTFTFTPTAAGASFGSLAIDDNAADTPQHVQLGGTAIDYSFQAAAGGSTSATVTAGQTATYNLAANTAGVVANIALSCSGTPPAAACNPSQSSLNLDGSNPVPFSVSVSTMANSLVPVPPVGPSRFRPSPGAPLVWVAACIVLAILLAAHGLAPRGTRARLLVPASAFLFLALVAIGCSGGSGSKTTGTLPGTYTLTLTGTGGGGTRTVKLMLKVN